MKKQRLFNRVGCALLSIAMILVLGMSPAATEIAKADWNTDITESVSIAVKQGTS